MLHINGRKVERKVRNTSNFMVNLFIYFVIYLLRKKYDILGHITE
jgi:hypothetical protein